MSSLIRSPRDFWCGLAFIAFGLAAVIISRNYTMGSGGQMGPAYFPTLLGGMLALVGVISGVRSFFRSGESMEAFSVGRGTLILLSVVLFAILMQGAGMFIAIMASVMVSGLASRNFRPLRYALFAAGLAAFCCLVFVMGLGLPVSIVGHWLS